MHRTNLTVVRFIKFYARFDFLNERSVYKLSVHIKNFDKLQDQKIFDVVKFNELQRKTFVFCAIHMRYE